MRTLRTHLPLLAVVGILGLLSASCSLLGGDTLTVTATFADVADLVPESAVKAGDVRIGTVENIELDDEQLALVTMAVEPDTGLPHDVQAVLSKTSLLGERFIDLRPLADSGQLEDGQHIENTDIVSDFEDLVATGNDLVGYVAATQVQAMVEVGARAFGGRGSLLGQFVDQVNGFVGEVDQGREDLVGLIDALDAWTAGLATNAETNAAALETLARASRALEEEDDRLLDTLEQVTRVSDEGAALLEATSAETDNFIRRLRKVLQQVTRTEGVLQAFLTWWPRHNLHVPTGAVGEHAQTWLDFIVCGVNDEPGDPAHSCVPPNPGQPNPEPESAKGNDECHESHRNCPGYEGEVREE